MQLPYGKYKGQELDSTPTEYLKWFEENASPSIQLRAAINAELKVRSSEETLGRSPESPNYVSFEEMLWIEIYRWLDNEHVAKRITINLTEQQSMRESLARMLKKEVPRLQKLWRGQKK
jgi:uncharacterized protein (DUF3820 family)